MSGEQPSAPNAEAETPDPESSATQRPVPGTPVLPDVTRDETDSWGERPDEDDDLERFRRERPPHHL